MHSSAQNITILVGTMTGTADIVAQEVDLVARDAGYNVNILQMDSVSASQVAELGTLLLCTSTYGNGDVPDNAQALLEGLTTERPNLSSVVYGVIALGDMTYKATFCQGAKQFDSLFSELGARRAGAPLLHDANAGTFPEDVAATWAATWLAKDLSLLLEAA